MIEKDLSRLLNRELVGYEVIEEDNGNKSKLDFYAHRRYKQGNNDKI